MKHATYLMPILMTVMTACTSTPEPASPNEAAEAVARVQASMNDAQNKAQAAQNQNAADQKAQIAKSKVPSITEAPVLLYESWPQETTLDNAHILDVEDAWISGIESAKETLFFSEFYTVYRPGTSLHRVYQAIKAAIERGVYVRFIIDKKMYKDDNVQFANTLANTPGIDLRIIDYSAIAGGVQHSKYFIVDGKVAFFGSQNFDWRSLQQISEMGARLALPELVEPLKQIYDIDWNLAADPTDTSAIVKSACSVPVETTYRDQPMTVETVASPKTVLPCDAMWDLPKIIAMIDNAKTSVAFQLLDYVTVNYDKTTFTEIDDALQRAAARGVKVRMLVSDWSTAAYQKMKDLKRLQQIDNIETKMLTVPEHSEGYVPFSRTIHSKFLVVDGDKAWLGTSNWSGDYFYASRNVGIIVTSQAFNADLTKSFDHYWDSPYTETVDPNKDYPKKKR